MKAEILYKIFDKDKWDFGVLSKREFKGILNRPLKSPTHEYGHPYFNPFDNTMYIPPSVVILARHSEVSYDYSLYLEYEKIIKNSEYFDLCFPIYCNFKEAAIVGGIAVRAKNSLAWNYKFGFDCKYMAFGVKEKLTHYEKEIDNGWLQYCTNCNDCRVNCPVDAIQNENEPYWLDSLACDDFTNFGNPKIDIPSVKDVWHNKICPDVPKEEIDLIVDNDTLKSFYKKYPQYTSLSYDEWLQSGVKYVPGIGLALDKKTPFVVSVCRECQVQPRCNKNFRERKFDYGRNN